MELIHICKECNYRSRQRERMDRHRAKTGHVSQISAAADTTLVSCEEFTEVLRERLPKTHGGRTLFAAELGVSTQFLSRVLRGESKPGPAIAKAMGYKQVVAFVELSAPIIEGKVERKR
jgi:hypothetical protein